MALGSQHVPTYPVWVGDLKQTVREHDLVKIFSSYGKIASCKIILNEQGLSRCDNVALTLVCVATMIPGRTAYTFA